MLTEIFLNGLLARHDITIKINSKIVCTYLFYWWLVDVWT